MIHSLTFAHGRTSSHRYIRVTLTSTINASSVQKVMLLGRSRDKDEISALLAGAAAGRGGARLFHGDPGMGRSALLRFAAAEAVGFVVVELFQMTP
jgi:hypothetical protein